MEGKGNIGKKFSNLNFQNKYSNQPQTNKVEVVKKTPIVDKGVSKSTNTMTYLNNNNNNSKINTNINLESKSSVNNPVVSKARLKPINSNYKSPITLKPKESYGNNQGMMKLPNSSNSNNSGVMDYKSFTNKVQNNNWGENMESVNNQFDNMQIGVNNPMFPRDGKVTKIFGKVTDENNKDTYHMYEVATKKADKVDIHNDLQKKNPFSGEEQEMIKKVFINGINSNKLTLGTKIMMDNERTHAMEAIDSGLYINWTSRESYSISGNNTIDCFRIGSKSKCICGHDFPEHEKIVTQKKFSSKCTSCKCKFFAFIPQLPEEVGEYWLPHRRGFRYVDWKGKCKCKHTWESHDVSRNLKCRDCNCNTFYSAFCCVVCNKFWHDHENTYELRKERISAGKPVDYDFLPLQEAPDIKEAVYRNIDMSKPKPLNK